MRLQSVKKLSGHRGRLLAGIAAAALAVVLAAPAMAAPSSTVPGGARWETFGTGQWVPGTGNNSNHGLVTTSVETTPGDSTTLTYGGAEMKSNMLPTTDPSQISALSYDFEASQSGGSGGSPRMVVEFSDGGNGALRPLNWVANTWTTENGMTSSDWDNSGGSCGFVYETTWSTIMACHPGATITGIFVVNDSGWLYPSTGEQVVLDNLTVNDTVAGGPGASS